MTANTVATNPALVAIAWPRSLISPVVFSARNTAPWVRNRVSVVNPPISAYGLSRLKKPPV